MSRPDDAMGSNAGHPTGWPRQQDMVTRDPVTGRPLVMAQTPEAWQNAQAAPAAGQAYHYPGQAGGQPGQEQFHAPAAVPQQHYQPGAQAAPRTQPAGRAQPAQQPEYAPQFARYSGGPEAQAQQYAADAYQGDFSLQFLRQYFQDMCRGFAQRSPRQAALFLAKGILHYRFA